MPNYITHALCANDILQDLNSNKMVQLIQKYPQVYALGSSGPDFLFYYRTFPWQDQSQNKTVHNVGNIVHSEKINDFYKEALRFCMHETSEEKRNIQLVYLAGHLMHYALDTIAHPFVFFHSGEMKGETKYWHYRLESMIDTVMVKQIKELDLAHVDAVGMVSSTYKVRKILSAFYAQTVKEVYGIDLDHSVYEECFETTPKVVKWLFDPHNLKFAWIQAGERASKNDWLFSSHMVTGKLDKKHDVLNLKHHVWNHPSDEIEVSTESFLDLYDKAIIKGQSILEALNKLFFEKGSLVDVLNVIGNLSYDTGKENAAPMQFYGSIYEDH